MKVTNNGVSQTPLSPSQPTSDASLPVRDAPFEAAAQPKDGYTPSAEWLRLVDLMKQVPEVRENRIREVTQRLQNGDYLSAGSAARTADALLRSME